MTACHTATQELPPDVWTAAGLPDDAAVLAGAGDLEAALLHWHGAPRDAEARRRFCRALPAGPVLLYGAGTLTRTLLDELPPTVTVAGIIDRMAGDIRDFAGYPVFTPAEAAALGVGRVLLAHNVFEMEMRRSLIAAGFAPETVITLHADPAYRALTAPLVAELTERAGDRPAQHPPIDALVVSCTATAIFNDRQLADWLAPARTLHLFLGRGGAGEFGGNGPYRVVDLQESLAALKTVVQRLRPRVIYVRTLIYKNHLGMLIKRWLPEAVVVQEFYDFTILWPDADLINLFGLDPVSINWLRQAERIAGETLDLVLSKRGGAEWNRVWGRCAAPYRMLFPQVMPENDRDAGQIADGAAGDLIYAGFLPAPSFLRAFPIGYNFLPLLEALGRDHGLTTDLFNSSHTPDASGDAIFAAYLRRYDREPLRYHGRLPYDVLLTRMQGYRFGWLANDQQTFHGDRRVGVCNRWTGYISAGIPTLLDPSWGFMGELVREYGAGIVADTLEAGAIADMIRTADHGALTAGVRRLRTRLLADNDRVMTDVITTLQAGSTTG